LEVFVSQLYADVQLRETRNFWVLRGTNFGDDAQLWRINTPIRSHRSPSAIEDHQKISSN